MAPSGTNDRMDSELGFELLWDGDACLVVNKPPGLLTQAPPGIDSLEVRVKRHLAAQAGTPHAPYLAVLHRLDRPASGVLVLARRINAARKLSLQFEHREIDKRYWAIVEGHVEPTSGEWIDWMRKVEGEARSEIAPADSPGAQQAILRYQVARRLTRSTLLEIELETGRTHQIRLQTASRGHPILGDSLYGSTTAFGPDTPDERARWIALHARRLEFIEPALKQRVVVEADPRWTWPE
jgi:23S rRNA pseudouridine1911/1915/1917 synthase